MDTAVTPFAFEDHLFRVIRRGDEPWFVLSDVCRVLEIVNSRDAAARLDVDERGVVIIDTPGGRQETTVITESGLYSLVLTSRKQAAKRFKKWVTGEVLPQIRRTGSYAGRALVPGHPDFGQAVRLVREARLTGGKAAAISVWRSIGLPWAPEFEPTGRREPAGPAPGTTLQAFIADCVREPAGQTVAARVLYEAYAAWALERGLVPMAETGFGRQMKTRLVRDNGRVRQYRDCALHHPGTGRLVS